ncbi:MAG: hypothetical protein BroJett039_04480 [Chloroflexota bacterium]|nr:MAG: hypothetical protein BroJett039_04480 [Chloroflexota bacterium]
MSELLPNYVTTRQAADMLGVDISQATRLVKSGRIEGIQIGREWLVFKASVEKYFQTKAHSGKPTSRRPKLAATPK